MNRETRTIVITKRSTAGIVALGVVFAILVIVIISDGDEVIRVGVLHSQTGTMAISEKPLIDAVILAVDEINQRGGLLGKRLELVIRDGASDPAEFARQAESLISDSEVAAIFGCWTSASRKTVVPVVEEHDHLLFYPLQYEGLETSPCVVYTGAAPNQQIIPALRWCLGTLGPRVYLVGSDYVYPRTANEIIRDYVRKWRGEIVGESYVVLGDTDVAKIIEEIQKTKPDVILNTINGDSNIAFFRGLRQAGITPAVIPTMSFSIAEGELGQMDPGLMQGDYAAWNYFQSIDTDVNRRFVARFRDKFKADRVTSDPMEAAYFGVHLWAQAVENAKTIEIEEVRDALRDKGLRSPGGMIHVDGETLHTWKTVHVGKIGMDGQFTIVWTSGRPIRPIPYPPQRTKSQWKEFLSGLHSRWGGRWVNPGAPR